MVAAGMDGRHRHSDSEPGDQVAAVVGRVKLAAIIDGREVAGDQPPL